MTNISAKQGAALLTMTLIGSSLIVNGWSAAGPGAWISVLLACVAALPLYLVYAALVKALPQSDVFDMLKFAFGKTAGKLLGGLFALFALFVGALALRDISEFLSVIALVKTPEYFLEIVALLTCIYMAKTGVEPMGRMSSLVLPAILAIIALIAVIAVNEMNPAYLEADYSGETANIASAGFYTLCAPLLMGALFLSVFKSLKDAGKSRRVFLTGLGVAGAVLLVTVLRNVMLLGATMQSILYYPSYSAATVVGAGDFLERMEVITAIVFLLCAVVKIAVCIFVAQKGAASALSLNSGISLAAPAGFLLCAISGLLFRSTTEIYSWLAAYSYCAVLFFAALPLALLIAVKLKLKRGKSLKQAER